jgi:4-hydroxyproline epimerase
MQKIQVVDSHTEGEPTRVVTAGAPDLGPGTAAERLRVFRERFDHFRSAVVNEPRGNDAIVGALLCEPVSKVAVAQVLFFNNVAYLGMCVHGSIGVAVTLRHLGRIGPGSHRLETPVGDVTITLDPDGSVAVQNVFSYRLDKQVAVATNRHGTVHGDIAWGGNWFFLIEAHDQVIAPERIEALTGFTCDVREALENHGITGTDGALIDHIEVFGPPARGDADSKNFVLCPGKAYDRSPCGTGTSAKLACLAADGKLAAGQVWRQESTIGSLFEGTYTVQRHGIIPTIRGRAWITAESTLLLDPGDPFRDGIRG